MPAALRRLVPAPALGWLLAIGFLDLVSTAVLHRYGLIVELNPLMRPLIERGEWLFVATKGATLVVAWVVMAWYCRHNRDFVNRACVIGGIAYLTIWTAWFLVGQA